MQMQKRHSISYIVFCFSLVIVIINLVSLFFPALIVTLSSSTESGIDSFTPGAWAIPILVTNLILLGLGILYRANRFPHKILNYIKFILDFEISSKVTMVIIIILIGSYIVSSVEELIKYEGDEWADFERIELIVKAWPYQVEGYETGSSRHINNFLLYFSQNILQNIRIIPFIGSIALLLLTYFFTVKLSRKRFSGIIALIVVLQSFTFLRYDTSATYPNFWILFYFLSLYIMYKKWYLSPIIFLLSVFSKPIVILFLPITLYFVIGISQPRKRKIFLTLAYVGIVVFLAAYILFDFSSGNTIIIPYDNYGFWAAFASLSYQLRFDSFILVTLLPLIIGLFIISLKGVKEANLILVLISGALFSLPLLASFTEYNVHPYRFMPFIIFFAVGVGMLFSKKITQEQTT